MKRAWRVTLWLVTAAVLLHVACKLQDFSFLRFTPVSPQEARELAERGFREACQRARVSPFAFVGPALQGTPDNERSEYIFDWIAQAGEDKVQLRVFVSTKGTVEWWMGGGIEGLRAGVR